MRDPIEGVVGTLVIDHLVDGVAAGGLRIATNVDRDTLIDLAAAMTRKQAAFGIRVGGAKAGLTMDPRHPARGAVLGRFVRALRPLIAAHWSVGPDVNTTMAELEAIGRSLQLPSLKLCVGRARGLDDATFLDRYKLFEARLGDWSVNELRGPSAVCASVLALLKHLGIPPEEGRVAVQGAGTMGGGAAHLLSLAGVRITAWADDQGCLVDPQGLPVDRLLAGRVGGRLPKGGAVGAAGSVLAAESDVLVLAAVSHAIAKERAPSIRCRGIVEAANLAVDTDVADALVDRGVLIVPDVLASAGGSLAVESLYASTPRRGQDVLDHVTERVRLRLGELLPAAAEAGVSVRSLVHPTSTEEPR